MSTPTKSPSTPVDVLIRMLDEVDDRPDATALRTRSYELLLTDLSAPPEATAAPGPVVDVGCGSGRAVVELSRQGVRAIGVDLSEQMIAVARRRWPETDVRVGDACSLPFQDGELAGYRADKVLHTLPDPARAIAEAHRVLAPGGRAVLIGQDWSAFVIDSDQPALTHRIVESRAGLLPNPNAARAQRRLLLDAGFLDVTIEVPTLVFTAEAALPVLSGMVEACREAKAITGTEADGWLAEQRVRAQADRLLLAMPIFMTAATRP